MLILMGCAYALSNQVTTEAVSTLPEQIAGISPLQWCIAAALTAGSFWAVAQYDVLAHKALDTGVPVHQARATGAIGIALGQTLGFGLLTGALARWRMLPDISLQSVLRLSAFVSATFMLAWAVVSALTVLVLPAPSWTVWPALLVIACVPVGAFALFWWPQVRFGTWSARLPTVSMATAMIGWAFLDTALAAGTLFVLLPTGTVPFVEFLPFFLIALGSGLISNTPGGMGPFELVLLAAVPLADPAPLLAAIFGYRVIYYALPALVAALALARPFAARSENRDRPASFNALLPAGEAQALAQNGGYAAETPLSALTLWPTGQTITQFNDPHRGSARLGYALLQAQAQAKGQLPFVYKCSARIASAGRTLGWRVLHIADDAHVALPDFSIDTPARRTLRRKLRSAEKAGVTVRTGPPLPDPAAMARVDTEWQQAHGTARGGSMGRYCPDYVRHQWVGHAYVAGRLVAFVTAHRADQEWCLDIMRNCRDAPDGTMHALVQAAIIAARRAGATRFSLAATPACPDPSSRFWRWCARHVVARAGGRGLRQFKSSFAPEWRPRYAAARSWFGLAIGLADVARAIHRPTPLTASNAYETHEVVENYEVASRHVA